MSDDHDPLLAHVKRGLAAQAAVDAILDDPPARTARFWMVWNKGGGAPTVTHKSPASAEREARRLAKLNPGHAFIVLAAVTKFKVAASEQQKSDQEAAQALRSTQ